METIIDCGTNKVMCDAAMTFLKAQWPVLFEKELFVVVNDSPCFAINASTLGERLVELHMVKTHMDAWKAGWDSSVPYQLNWKEGHPQVILYEQEQSVLRRRSKKTR